MRPTLRTVVCSLSLLVFFAPQFCVGEEPIETFLEGLRERGYYDTAIDYIGELEKRTNLPADLKSRLSYEQASTLLQSARRLTNPDAQSKQLDQAIALLEKFTRESPNHPLAGQANTERAQIILEKGRVEIWQSRMPSNEGTSGEFQKRARKYIQDAKKVFVAAHKAYEKEFESFDTFIDPENKQLIKKRLKAEALYIQAQLNLAICTYELSQTYAAGDKKRNETLIAASLEFEEIHTKYRSQNGGLYAHLMQGKCFEEQGDLRKALGIYDKILEHNAKSQTLKTLQDLALQFRLICLNHEERSDYTLAALQASEWISNNRRLTRTRTGLGIRWQRAIAQETLAGLRTTEEKDKNRLLKSALEDAREINRFPGEYKGVSQSMIRRLLVAMDREPGDPKDFDGAFGLANQLLDEVGKARAQLEGAEKAGDKKKIEETQQLLNANLSESERMWKLAIQLASPQTPQSQIFTAQYRLAYVLYLQRESYEVAAIGTFLMEQATGDDRVIALDAGYLALGALVQIHNEASPEQRMNLQMVMEEKANRIVQGWPKSDRAVESQMILAQVYRQANEPLKAAQWYSKITAQAKYDFPIAQLEGGQAFWTVYLEELSKVQGAPTDEILDYRNKAEKMLANGIKLREAQIPASTKSPSELIRAKVSLAQLSIMKGDDQKSVDLLTKQPHSPIDVANKAKSNPNGKGFESKEFASFTYQQLLRAYVGLKKLDEAGKVRESLEQLAGGADSANLTQVYVELGRELQRELERLQQAGQAQRANEVRSAFEAFLQDLAKRKEGQTYGSLIWIAETYFGLAAGLKDTSDSTKYYGDAAKSYQSILDKAASDPSFADANRLSAVRLRMISCLREKKDFTQGSELLASLVTERPKSLDVQMEAARFYQAWGAAEEVSHFNQAINGTEVTGGGKVWGWGQIGIRLQRIIDAGQATEENGYEDKERESRYELANARYEWALQSADQQVKEAQLSKAAFELVAYTSISPALVETSWWDQFDTLYQDIQSAQGLAAVALEKPKPVQAVAVTKTPAQTPAENSPAKQNPSSSKASAAKESSGGGMMTYAIFGIVVLGGLGGIVWVGMNSKPKRRRSSSTRKKPAPKATPPQQGKPKKRATKPVAAGEKKPRPKPQAKTKPKPNPAEVRKKRPASAEKPQKPKRPKPTDS